MKKDGKNNQGFHVIVLGIIFDPAKKKILIGKRENNSNKKGDEWRFPGGRIKPGEDIDKTLKTKIKEKTGYKIKNLGTFFSNTYPQSENLVAIYFLTQVFEGKEKPGRGLTELRWVGPEELKKYLAASIHKKLHEFLLDLK